MNKRRMILLFLLALAGGAGWIARKPLAEGWRVGLARFQGSGHTRPRPDPATYAILAKDLEKNRVSLAAQLRAARGAAEKAAVEREARALLELNLPAMMRCWLGTPWDFNGTAEAPGKGKIACGYFVSTVLKDAGFRVNRYQLAQQPSGNILRSFVAKEACGLSVGRAFADFASEVRRSEPGIYLVGLDSHIAFIVVRDGDFHFIHSAGWHWVVDESSQDAGALKRSNWRMLANLTADPGVIRRWLAADKIAVKGT